VASAPSSPTRLDVSSPASRMSFAAGSAPVSPIANRAAALGPQRSTVVSSFIRDHDRVIGAVSAAKPHFIRCLRPNKNGTAKKFDRIFVSHQIAHLGVAQAVSIFRSGFPIRLLHEQAWAAFRCLVPVSVRRELATVRAMHIRCDRLLTRLSDGCCPALKPVGSVPAANQGMPRSAPKSDLAESSPASGARRSIFAFASPATPRGPQGPRATPSYAVGRSRVFFKPHAFKAVEALRVNLCDESALLLTSFGRMAVHRGVFLRKRGVASVCQDKLRLVPDHAR